MNKQNKQQRAPRAQPRTALITGASRGLGLALATALAQRGWQLIIDARSGEALHEAEHMLSKWTRVVAIRGDVSDAAHRQALAEAAREVGGVDAVVNNAGLLGPSPQPHLLDYPLDVLETVYRANVIAPLGVVQALRPHLNAHARMINVTSDASVEAYAGWGGYGSSKAALEQVSYILAAENPDWRVYWVDPGDMRTQMHQDAFPGEDISDRPLPEASVPGLVSLLEDEHPSGRYKARDVLATPVEEAATATGVSELRVVLAVRDLDSALRTYRDGLGLQMLERWDSREGSGAVLASGRATIELLDASQAEHIEQVETDRAQPDGVRLAFRVNDALAASDALQTNGAEVVAASLLTPWNHLSQRLRVQDQQVTVFQPQPEAVTVGTVTVGTVTAGTVTAGAVVV